MLFFIKKNCKEGDIPLVFLHGFLGSHADFEAIVDILNLPSILIDLFGHGSSPSPPTPFSFSHMADAIALTLAKTGYSKFYLIGYSMGGRIALHLGLRHEKLFEKVILLSSHLGLTSLNAKKKHKKWHKEWMGYFNTLSEKDFLDKWYEQPLFAPLKEKPFFPALLKTREKQNFSDLKMLFDELSLLKQPSYAFIFPKGREKFKLICGDLDLKYKTLYHYLKRSHKASVTVIKEAGHALHLESPEATAKAILELIDIGSTHDGN